MAPKISRYFTTSGRMSDVNCVAKIETLRDRREIVGIVIHIVTVRHLRGPSMTAPVVRDNAVPLIQEKHHLRVPVVR